MRCEKCGFENAEGERYCRNCGNPLGAAGVPTTLGPYELLGELGRGAMARVWRAWDPRLRREVAIKEPLFDPRLPPAVLEEMGRRFVAEGVAAARLNHPNIVTIFEADVFDGRPAIVMELVDGATLAQLLEAGPLEPAFALDLACQLLDAVGYAHAQGIVHRDIKPDNVFVRRDGRVKLSDFGIAHVEDSAATHATMAGAVLGTPGYMSPEQALGNPVDARSDLFSIGIVAYEMLAGRNPFGDVASSNPTTLLYRIVHEPAPELSPAVSAALPADVRPAIMAALAKDPAERPQRAEDFRAMLLGQAGVPPTAVRTPGGGAVPPGATPSYGTSFSYDASSAQGSGSSRGSGRRMAPYLLVGVAGLAVLAVLLVSALSSAGGGGSAPVADLGAPAVSAKADAPAAKEADPAESDEVDKDTAKDEAANEAATGNDAAANAPANEQKNADDAAVEAQPVSAASDGQSAPGQAAQPEAPSAPAAAPAPASSPADHFPHRWSGTYVGTSSYVQTEDHHISRAVAFDFTDVRLDGSLSGICYVGTDTPGPGETYGTCYVEGYVAWDTGEVTIYGTGWIDQGGLGELRVYHGRLDGTWQGMSGEASDVGTGAYQTPWSVAATDHISILQNGSWTEV